MKEKKSLKNKVHFNSNWSGAVATSDRPRPERTEEDCVSNEDRMKGSKTDHSKEEVVVRKP